MEIFNQLSKKPMDFIFLLIHSIISCHIHTMIWPCYLLPHSACRMVWNLLTIFWK
jgi:hypothetical protein